MAIKSFKLSSNAQRAVLFAVGLVFVSAVYFAVKWCLASTLVTQAQSKEVAEFAVGLSPNDPKTHYALAVLRERTFLPEDFARSLEEYERAISLAPRDYRRWFDLGKARDRNGDAEGAEKSVEKGAGAGAQLFKRPGEIFR